MKKRLLILLLCLSLGACALGLTACGHTHKYTDVVTAPTCTQIGYTLHTCECGDVVTDTYVEKLGHSFTSYVSNNDASYTADGTKTAICDREGCGATDTVTDDGSKLQGYISFKNLTATENNVYGVVNNDTETFSFIDEVERTGDVTYIVTLDEFGINPALTKIVPLEIGDNKVYVFELIDGEINKYYTVTIRRKPMYVVTFNTQGSSVDSQTIEEDSFAVEPETNPTRAGYTFDGWDFDFSSAITDNTTINAKWTANTNTPYKVEYYLENLENNNYTRLDSATENLTGTTDTTVNAEIKTFDHFTVENSLVSGNLNGNGSTVLKVYYSRNYYYVSVNKLDNKGTVTGSGSFANAENATVTATVNAGYTFNGWFNGEEKVSENLSYTFNPVGNITLTAKWTVNTNTPYKVEYYLENLENNNYTKLDSETENLTGTTDTTVYAEIKTFDHFTVESSLVSGNVNGNGSTVLKVFYQRNEYTVTFDLDGGTRTGGGALSQTVKYGGSANSPTATKTGYTLSGFNKSLNNILSPVTIKANWMINQYTITIVYGNGQENKEITQDYNSDVNAVLPITLSRSGYGFGGWDRNIPSVMPANNITITAKWNAIFNLNGGRITGLTSYGKTLTRIVIPEYINGVEITSIGDSAFYYCTSLTSVVIGDSVTSIDDYAFYYCYSLRSVTIGNSVESIGEWAFYSCDSLTSIFFNGTTNEWNAVTREAGWKSSVPATFVQCSDGKVNL